MSAYLVADETVNIIVSHLHFNRNDMDWLVCEFREAIAGSTGDFCADLGAALFAMNIVAVEDRYGEGEAAKFRALDYKFKMTPASPRQVYAAIKELQYQCSEGDLPKTPLFGLLVSLRASVADEIIEAVGRQLELEAELENSLYARCMSCCKGLPHNDNHCGAPTARKLPLGIGRIHETVGK